MNSKSISQLSIEIVLKYYENDVKLFLDHVDDDILWYGPAEGQFFQGKKAMVEAWSAENHPLTFSVSNIQVASVSRSASLVVVVLTYCVITHYPSGNDIPINQRIAFTWCERISNDEHGNRITVPRILLCDITNPHPKSEEDTIYPIHFEEVHSGFTAVPSASERIHFHGRANHEYFLYANTIVWGESCGNGQRCILHLSDGKTAEIAASVRDVTAGYPDQFLRCHRSYFVNPQHVISVSRFTVKMRDGASLPVPEKSYTAFKRALTSALQCN